MSGDRYSGYKVRCSQLIWISVAHLNVYRPSRVLITAAHETVEQQPAQWTGLIQHKTAIMECAYTGLWDTVSTSPHLSDASSLQNIDKY